MGTWSRTLDWTRVHVSGTGTWSRTLNRSTTTASRSSRMLGLRHRLAQRGMSAIQLDTNGARARPQQLANLGGCVLADVTQRDTRPLLRGQVGQQAQELGNRTRR